MNTKTHPKIVKRPADSRGKTDLGWLQSQHTFSFGDYYDPAYVGYHGLRVINDDRVAPGQGFGMHSHRNMEIFSYVIEGSLEHRDSLGNGRIIQAGEFQYMSAGEGIMHSEFNPDASASTHFLQIWLQPQKAGGAPRYEELKLLELSQDKTLTLVASGQETAGAIHIRQQAEIYLGQLKNDQMETLNLSDDLPYGWLHVIEGTVSQNNERYEAGDSALVEGGSIEVTTESEGRFFWFKLA